MKSVDSWPHSLTSTTHIYRTFKIKIDDLIEFVNLLYTLLNEVYTILII